MMDSVVKLSFDTQGLIENELRKPEENNHYCFLGYFFHLYSMVSFVYFFINSVIKPVTLKYLLLVSNTGFFSKI